MIIVTGTKRSGTSMWMQILIAAGFAPFGEAFPRKWGKTIRDANKEGFYESMLRSGIYWRTNPHPQTGAYFFPQQVERHVVKVFIPGLVRSDRAYVGSVVATMRAWREYEASLTRLYAMEDEGRAPDRPAPVRMPPALEWWHENYMLLRDIAIRRHRVHVQSYDGLLAAPHVVIPKVIEWLGDGDADAAMAAVKPELRTQARPESSSVEPEHAAVFDELYDTVHAGQPITAALLERLNATNRVLGARVAEHARAIARDRARRRSDRKDRGRREPPADLEDVDPVPSW